MLVKYSDGLCKQQLQDGRLGLSFAFRGLRDRWEQRCFTSFVKEVQGQVTIEISTGHKDIGDFKFLSEVP